jgi:ATP-binding cassette subfamily B multidrug efflux pump
MTFDRLTKFFLNLCDPYAPHIANREPANQVWPYIRASLRPIRIILILSVISTLIAASIEVWLISYAGQLIDKLAETPKEDIWSIHGNGLFLAAMIILILRPMSQFVRHAMNDIGVQCNVANLYRWRAHTHLAHQSVGWFQSDFAGRTSFRLTDHGNHAANVIFHFLNALAFGLVYMIGVITLMAGTDLRLALPIFIWMGLYIGIMVFFIPRMVRAQQKFQGAKSAMVGSVVDTFSNFDTMKLFASNEAIKSEYQKDLENTRQTLFKTRQIGVSMRTLVLTLEGVIMIGFVGYGIFLWSNGLASIGLVGSAIALTFRITTMADWILDAVWSIFLNVGSMREALKTLSQPLAIPHDPKAPDLVFKGGVIEIEDVRHHYGSGQGGLNDLSLRVEAGEKIGVVGSSGAGKSTLVNLLLRFFEAEKGDILIDGQSIKSINEDSLRGIIGMVSQQASLLNRSVKDNIALGHDDISLTQITQAAITAKADEFIQDLKDHEGRLGYDAHVGERGVKLSGGQRQRIALARVILKDAPILILDEATSALDSEVEAEIQAALEGVMGNKTVIAIAHRLSTIAQMDRIIVLENGRIVENGTHDELLGASGLYASFWNRQSGGFLRTDD